MRPSRYEASPTGLQPKTAYNHAWEIRDAYGYHPYDDPAWGETSPYLPAWACVDARGGLPLVTTDDQATA
ncbi:DUF4158 domain-containing protein [Streptomyces sp. WZ.A104]|uniref:DUF4158 domain-containing protein n=1 Tax=Streptomyces sp. WZ.A104 TaxID=2023771 RepID=UPI001181018A|nr:DUF4158 domain-containing protein [Streptomyces sp. WZ.A104]